MNVEDYETLEALMQEPSGGHNHGLLNGNTLDTEKSVAFDFLFDGGWGIADIRSNKDEAGGLVSHRGILADAEEAYVDRDVVRDMALEAFGFTADEIASVYHTKKIKAGLSQLRAAMDARMLALRASGANMFQFAEAVGINQRTMNRALVRAEEAAS